jgi:hypothetical protein
MKRSGEGQFDTDVIMKFLPKVGGESYISIREKNFRSPVLAFNMLNKEFGSL